MSLERCDSPIKNWSLTDLGPEAFPKHSEISGDAVTKYVQNGGGCRGCPIRCKGKITIETGAYKVTKAVKPEYQTLSLLGSNTMVDNVEAIIKASDMCDRVGLDTISTGSVIAWAMECYEKGVITKDDAGDVDLTWGNADAVLTMIEKIAHREGLGDILAEGTKKAAERIGKGSEEWTMQIGGQDFPGHGPLPSIGFGWAYVCDPTPGRHTAAQMMHNIDVGIEFAYQKELQLPAYDDPLDYETNAKIYAKVADLERVWTSAGLCNFAMFAEYFPLIEILSAITGWDLSLDEILKTGCRIQTLRQEFNIREGVNTTEWVVPERLAATPTVGTYKGRVVDFKLMKKKGYEALGWDPETGRPLESSLDDLDLKHLVGQL